MHALGIIALSILIALGVLAAYLPWSAERKMRQQCTARAEMEFKDWTRRFYPNYSDSSEHLKRTLAIIADIYDVRPTQLRPSDVLKHKNWLAPLVLEDCYTELVSRLAIEFDIDESSLAHEQEHTVSTLINNVVAELHRKRGIDAG